MCVLSIQRRLRIKRLLNTIPTSNYWSNKVDRWQAATVSLLRGRFQGIKRMMMLTTHGLFLTCIQEICILIYTTQNQLFRHKPQFKMQKKTPHLLGRLTSCSYPLWSFVWHRLPSPYFPNPPTPSHPSGPYYITMMTSTNQQLPSSCPEQQLLERYITYVDLRLSLLKPSERSCLTTCTVQNRTVFSRYTVYFNKRESFVFSACCILLILGNRGQNLMSPRNLSLEV